MLDGVLFLELFFDCEINMLFVKIFKDGRVEILRYCIFRG